MSNPAIQPAPVAVVPNAVPAAQVQPVESPVQPSPVAAPAPAKENPAIKPPKSAKTPVTAAPEAPVENSGLNEDGFVPGEDISYAQLVAHSKRTGRKLI